MSSVKANGYLRKMMASGVLLAAVIFILLWRHHVRMEDYQKLGRKAMLEIAKIPDVVTRLDTLETRFDETRAAIEQHFQDHP